MSEASAREPQLDSAEDLFRAILYPHWWVRGTDRPSSAAFDDEVFSVDIASRTTPEETIQRFRPGSGLVQFNCGEARSLGFDARDEQDPAYPDNQAHAHVYFDGSKSSRKRQARKLAEKCNTVVAPTFSSP